MTGQKHTAHRVVRVWTTLLAIATAGLATTLAAQYAWMLQERANDPSTYIAEADRLMKLRDMAGALRQVEEALQRSPGDPDIHTFAGHIYFEFKHWEEARKAYEEAMAQGGRDPGARANLLWSLIEAGEYDRAITLGTPWAKDNGPGAADGAHRGIFNRYVAEAHIRSQRRPEAIPYLEDALRVSGSDIYLMTQLALAYERAGRPGDAAAMQSRIDEIQAHLPRFLNESGVFQPAGEQP